MTNPAVIIVTGLVVAVAAVIAVFASNSARPQAYERRGTYRPSPPPSPMPMLNPRRRERRRKSRTRSPCHPDHELSRDSTENLRKTCQQCGESPYVKVSPCNHELLCKGCFADYIETNDTCPTCKGRIDSCVPTIPPFGKCEGCRKFTKIIKFLPCSHSLALCVKCFEERGRSYKECPVCKSQIREFEPKSTRIGICKVCKVFTRFAIFQPCGHAGFCRKHAENYLKNTDQECHDCGGKVVHIS